MEERSLWNRFIVKGEQESPWIDKHARKRLWTSQGMDILKPEVSSYLIDNGFNPIYDGDKEFAVCTSHDIDFLYDKPISKRQILRYTIGSILRLKLKRAFDIYIKSSRREIKSDFHIRNILEVEAKYNTKSSFYFLAIEKFEEDYNYEIEEITSLFEEITHRGNEIGLHGGHNAFNNLNKLKTEKERLERAIGQKVFGYRNHFLKFENPKTWDYLNNLDFEYDTTFGFADSVGFRNGMCHPFNPYSAKDNDFLDIFEIPLILMDVSLWSYMGLNTADQLKISKWLIDIVKEKKGVLSLLWHNTQMTGHEGRLFNDILEYAYSKDAWMPSGIELIKYWKKKGYDSEVRAKLIKLKK